MIKGSNLQGQDQGTSWTFSALLTLQDPNYSWILLQPPFGEPQY